MTGFEEIKRKLADRGKAGHLKTSPISSPNHCLTEPASGTLPKEVMPKRELLYLAVGIPSPNSLPKKTIACPVTVPYAMVFRAQMESGHGRSPAGIDWKIQTLMKAGSRRLTVLPRLSTQSLGLGKKRQTDYV
jgi:hypothetical protein